MRPETNRLQVTLVRGHWYLLGRRSVTGHWHLPKAWPQKRHRSVAPVKFLGAEGLQVAQVAGHWHLSKAWAQKGCRSRRS